MYRELANPADPGLPGPVQQPSIGSTVDLRLEKMAEAALDDAHGGRLAEAELQARRVLDTVGPKHSGSRAMALEALALVRSHSDRQGMSQGAESLFVEAATIWSDLGQHERSARTLLSLCREVDVPAARYRAALDRIEGILGNDRNTVEWMAEALLCRADIHLSMGELEAVADDLDGLLTSDGLTGEQRALASLLAASAASLADAPLEAVQHVRDGARQAALLPPEAAADFHARAADVLDLCGEVDLAWDHLERAHSLVGERATMPSVVAELALHARHGDPSRAEEAAVALRRFPPAHPAEEWRLLLLRAMAAHRRRDHRAERLAARAFEEAASLGLPELPLIREPAVARRLLDVAIAGGSTVAATFPRTDLGATVRLLGAFDVRRGGETVALNDQAALIIKLLACAGGRMHVEEVVEAIWPDSPPGRGRQRLRNALTRLRRADEGLVVREGETLRFGDGVVVDAYEYEREARRALAAAAAAEAHAPAIARSAVYLYEDELLPFDRYLDWTAPPRERLRRLYVTLLDVLVRDARARGELDVAVELLELGLQAEPQAEERYLAAARLHLECGRRSQALRLLHGARRAADDLSIPVSREHHALEASIRTEQNGTGIRSG